MKCRHFSLSSSPKCKVVSTQRRSNIFALWPFEPKSCIPPSGILLMRSTSRDVWLFLEQCRQWDEYLRPHRHVKGQTKLRQFFECWISSKRQSVKTYTNKLTVNMLSPMNDRSAINRKCCMMFKAHHHFQIFFFIWCPHMSKICGQLMDFSKKSLKINSAGVQWIALDINLMWLCVYLPYLDVGMTLDCRKSSVIS